MKSILNIVRVTKDIVNAFHADKDVKAISFDEANTTRVHIYSRESAKWNPIQSNIGAKSHGAVMLAAYIDATLNALVAEINVDGFEKLTDGEMMVYHRSDGRTKASDVTRHVEGHAQERSCGVVIAGQIEVKNAQGTKTCESGQLTGKKVDTSIASLRNSKPRTAVSVKMVVLWKCDNGPWELILTEMPQTLNVNGFTEKVNLRVEGDLKIGVVELMIAEKGAGENGFYRVDFNSTITGLLVADAKNFLKFVDFGNVIIAGKNDTTPYLVSRLYRTREIIIELACDHHVGICSVGYCLLKLYKDKVFFPSATTNKDMFHLNMELKLLATTGFIVCHASTPIPDNKWERAQLQDFADQRKKIGEVLHKFRCFAGVVKKLLEVPGSKYLTPFGIIDENGKVVGTIADVTNPRKVVTYYLEHVSYVAKTPFISDTVEQVDGISVVIVMVATDCGKGEGKKKRSSGRIWVLYIVFIHLEDKVKVWAAGIHKPRTSLMIHSRRAKWANG